MRLTLGDQGIDFSKSEWERAKQLILETEFQGDENEVGVFTDEEAKDSGPIRQEDALEFMSRDLQRITEKLQSLPRSKLAGGGANVLGLPIPIATTRGNFKNAYLHSIAYLAKTVTGPGVKSITISLMDPSTAQHVVVYNEEETKEETENKDTEVSGDIPSVS